MAMLRSTIHLTLGALLVLALAASALGATDSRPAGTAITVDTTGDVISTDGFCSLREAVVASNLDSPFSDCPAGNGADTILFSTALPLPVIVGLAIAGTGEDAALTGDLDLTGSLTISATAPVVVDGNGLDRVFEIRPGSRVTIRGLTVQNGDPGAGADGGGVAVDSTAVLTLAHSSVISNTAQTGGGIKVWGRLNLSDSAVDRN